jgi:hypothetical protein
VCLLLYLAAQIKSCGNFFQKDKNSLSSLEINKGFVEKRKFDLSFKEPEARKGKTCKKAVSFI